MIYLRPLPSAVGTLRIFTYDKPTEVTTASQVLDIPLQFHRDLVNFVVREMALKDQNGNTANFYATLWINALKQAKAWNKKRKRGDEFQVVKNMDDLAKSVLGTV